MNGVKIMNFIDRSSIQEERRRYPLSIGGSSVMLYFLVHSVNVL